MRLQYPLVMTLVLVFALGTATAAVAAPRLEVLDPDAGSEAPDLKLVEHSATGCRVQVSVPVLEVEEIEVDGTLRQALTLPGGGLPGEPGAPGLPTCSGLLAVPAGRVVEVQARVVASRTLEGYRPLAIQEEEADAAIRNPAKRRDVETSRVTLGEPAIMHGVRVVPFTVHPVEQDAENGTITVATELDLTFTFQEDGDAPATVRTLDYIPESFDRLFESVVLNWEVLRDDAEVGPGTWLAICPNNAAVDAILPLISWRQRQGYDVMVATTQEIGTSNTAIKNYIQSVYNTAATPLEYVCLVGDAGGQVAVACWYENESWYGGEGDHYYTTLEGGDILADVHIGRLTCRNIGELQGIVNKIVTYETEPPTLADPGWFTRATLTGDPGASGQSTIYVNQWVKAQLMGLGYTQVDTIFNSPFASRMFASCDQGVSVFTYRGYLGVSGFNTGYIDALDNGHELPFAVIPTCASGSFADYTHTYSEAFLRNPDGGGIGAIGTATTGTHTRYNNCYFQGVWEGILNEGNRHLGAGHTRGKLELFKQYAANEPDIPEIWSMWNNLMGDPASEMWQALPVQLAVTHPAELPIGASAVPVIVTDGSGPVAGARVAVFKDGEIRSVTRTDAGGQVTLPIAGYTTGSLLVTVTGHDLYPYQGAVTLGSVNTFANLEDWQLDDGAGNGDGQANPGESLALQLALRNLGDELAGGVTAVVVSESDHVTVQVPQAVFGDLAPGALVWGGPVSVQIAPTAPDGALAALRVTAVSGGTNWVSQLMLPVVAANPVITTSAWTGGLPVAGTAGELEVTLRNDGSRPTSGAVATLRTHSPYLLLDGAETVAVGAMPLGGTATIAFPLVIRDDCFGGHLAACTLQVTTDEGSVHELEITLAIGSIDVNSPTGPDSYGYLAFDNLDPDPNAPVYSWVEIDPNHGGSGTNVGLSDFGYEGDDTDTLQLPFSFRYYGQDFDEISICSNGWVAFGPTTLKGLHNWSLPYPGIPNPLLAVFWDNLVQSGSNRVYFWHDVANGRYIVQWSRMRNRANGTQNCEVILYDPAQHPTLTGDGLIVFQYNQVANNDSSRNYATTGIQNLDGSEGITYTYYADYARGARTLQSGRAIAWVSLPRTVADAAIATPEMLDFDLDPGGQESQTIQLAAVGEPGAVLSYTITRVDGGGPVPRLPGQDADKQLPGVTLDAPNGGEVWLIGEPNAITWTADEAVNNVRLDIDRGKGEGWENLTPSVPAAAGSWTWTVAGQSSADCRIRVRDLNDILAQDVSDGSFTVTRDLSWLTVTPEAGYLAAGQSVPVEVMVDASNLAVGLYQVDLVITHNAGSPLVVPVRVEVGQVVDVPDAPAALALAPVHPNPFNPRCEISFVLPAPTPVRLTVHDLTGRRVAELVDEVRSAGSHRLAWDGTDGAGRRLSSGTYLLRLDAGGDVRTQKMVLVK